MSLMWPWKKPPVIPKLSGDAVQAQADHLRQAWAEFHRQAKEAEAAGLSVFFVRDGLGEPFTGPRHFRADLKVLWTETL